MTNDQTERPQRAYVVTLVGLTGMLVGVVAGYLGYFLTLNIPVVHSAPSSQQPFDQMFDGMARLRGLELAAANCNGASDLPRIVSNEKRLVDLLAANEQRANLDPQLDVARAIIAHRSADLSNARSDKVGFAAAVEDERTSLQAAGWKDISPEQLTGIVDNLDRCSGSKREAKDNNQ